MFHPSDKIFTIKETPVQTSKRHMIYGIIEQETPKTFRVSLNQILKNPLTMA